MKLNNYIKYSFYPKKQSKNFIFSIIIVNILFFLIFIFKASKYNENCVYEREDKDYLKTLSSTSDKSKLLEQNGLVNTTSFLITADIKVGYQSSYYNFTNSYDFLFMFGKEYKVLYSQEFDSNDICFINKEYAKKVFGVENAVGRTIVLADKEFVVSQVLESDNRGYGFYSRYTKYPEEMSLYLTNDLDFLKDERIISITASYNFTGIEKDNFSDKEYSLIQDVIKDFYSNRENRELFYNSYKVIFDTLDMIKIFSLIYFVINTLILLMAKYENIKYDLKVRKYFFENENSLIKGYTLSFSILIIIGLIISLFVSEIVHILLCVGFGYFNWINLSVIIYLIVELLSSILLSYGVIKFNK